MITETFTLAVAIQIQKEQLDNWKTKLKSKCYIALKNYAIASNEGKTSPFSIKRGTDLVEFIENWKG